MSNPKLKNIVEGFIFASDKALNVDQLLKMFPDTERPEKDDIIAAIEQLQADFTSHGVELKKVSTGYRFQVREEYTQWVSRLWEERPHKYTRALLETLALIVYRQPITRGEIEEIRGVSVSSNIVRTLQEREWVKVVGNRDVPGRPALLASTKEFLDYFNLESLEDLPPLSEIKDLDAIATELDPEQNAALIAAIRDMQESQKSPAGGSPLGDEQAPDDKQASDDEQGIKPENKSAESVEEIAAEIEKVIEIETKIETVEEKIETELVEQTEHEQVFFEENSEESEESENAEEPDNFEDKNALDTEEDNQFDDASIKNKDEKIEEV